MPRKKRRSPRPRVVNEGWRIAELSPMVGFSLRQIRYLLTHELVPKPVFHGTDTRYRRRHLIALLAVQLLQKVEKLKATRLVKARMDKMSRAELEAYVLPRVATAEMQEELGITGPLSKALESTAPPKDPNASPAPGSAEVIPGQENWSRIAVLPGLEIHLRSDASPLVRRLVKQFHADCVGAGSG